MIGISTVPSENKDRKEMYSIDEVLSKILPISLPKNKAKVDFDGDLMKMSSHRYHTFVKSGIKCVCCGIEGKYFVKEKFKKDKGYHFNLYALNENGEEILMTKDHIVAKSKGGKDCIENYQTMCITCNNEKGTMSQEEFDLYLKEKEMISI